MTAGTSTTAASSASAYQADATREARRTDAQPGAPPRRRDRACVDLLDGCRRRGGRRIDGDGNGRGAGAGLGRGRGNRAPGGVGDHDPGDHANEAGNREHARDRERGCDQAGGAGAQDRGPAGGGGEDALGGSGKAGQRPGGDEADPARRRRGRTRPPPAARPPRSRLRSAPRSPGGCGPRRSRYPSPGAARR